MSHTIVEMFIKVVPTHLYRHGAKNSPQLHKLRTMPPRTIEESFDIELYEKNNNTYVSKDTGGISTFNQQNPRFGKFWWVIPKGTKIPVGLRISKDFNSKPSSKPTHYTIRPVFDMPLSQYIGLLDELSASAERLFEVNQKKSGRV